ncbi:MAG: exo-alpha-sialidase [Anaerolineae bacterium]|nr:exo-alpha-sialidase [Anaerolineae bacterium]
MPKQIALVPLLALPFLLFSISLAYGAPGPQTVQPIYDGPELDYQPSVIRLQPSGDLMVVFERINPSSFYGDFYVTFSSDNGETWSLPQAIVDSPLNERHPSVVQLGPSSFALFYLVDEGGGAYRLHRATSSDGVTWSDQGMIDLGWSSPGEINPTVIREADGTLTMTYHRYGGPSYIAQSTDDGVTWDTLMTQVSDGSAPLPRLAKRESDGLYIVSYQVNPGGNNLDIYAKTSYDPYDWSGPQVPVSTDINSHDSQPIVLEDGTLLVAYAKTYAGYFDIFYRTSCDGVSWAPEVRVTFDGAHYDTQPHPLLQGTLGHVILTWPHQESVTPYEDHDVWIDTDIVVPMGTIDKSVTPSVFAPNDRLTYILHATNDFYCAGTGWLVDPIPPEITYVPGSLWASGGSYGYNPAGQAITWTGTISNAQQVTITFQVTATGSLIDGDVVTNTAWLTETAGTVQLAQAMATADTLPPTSAILDPAAGQLISGTGYLIGGVASDTVSGIAEVAVSVDGGPWEVAAGAEAWSYLWTGLTDGEHNLRSRSTDGVGRVQEPGPGITVTVDNTPPALAAFTPISGAVDVPLTATVALTFSEPIVTPTLAFQVAPDPGGWSAAWNGARTAVTLSHDGWNPAQIYTFTLAQARDAALNPITPTAWSFAALCQAVEIVAVTTEISACTVTFGAELAGTPPFSYTWDFGLFGGSTVPTPTVDFGASGTYPVTLTVQNGCGQGVHALDVTCGLAFRVYVPLLLRESERR